jgi:predicted ABC-type exoprotein transport system permease subunit
MSTFDQYERLRTMFAAEEKLSELEAYRHYSDTRLKMVEQSNFKIWLEWLIKLAAWEKQNSHLAM